MTSVFSDADAALIQLGRELQKGSYKFITPTPATHERVNGRPQNGWATNIEGVLGWSRPFKAEILAPELLDLMKQAEILAPHEAGWRARLRVSSLSGQFFFHSAYPTLEADSVFFGPDTYRFASAIEQLFLGKVPPIRRAVDICCGAGPGAVGVANFCPDATVLGLDINAQALRLTRINAELAGARNIEAHHSNLLHDVAGDFDLMVANPPYLVDPSERAYRHGGGPLGAGLSLAIVDAAQNRLAPGGTLLLYTGVAIIDGTDPFRVAVAERLAESNVEWSYRETDPDVFGEELLNGPYIEADRIAAVVLTARRVG